MSTIVTVAGINYTIPAFNDPPSTGWGNNLSAFFIAVAANIASSPAFMQTVAVAATPQAVVSGKTYLVNSAALAVTLNLPAPVVNLWFIVKDTGFNCQVNNITIHRNGTEKIDNVAADFVLTNNGSAWIFASDGTNWYSLGNSLDMVLVDIANGQTMRILSNGGVLSSQRLT